MLEHYLLTAALTVVVTAVWTLTVNAVLTADERRYAERGGYRPNHTRRRRP